jgi:aspartate kinase
MIVSDDAPDAGSAGVRGISGKNGYTVLRVYKNAAGGGARLLEPILAAVKRYGAAPDFALSAVDAATRYFAAEIDFVSLRAALDEGLAVLRADETSITERVTLIAIVGGGVGAGAAAKVAGALAEAGIAPYGACFSVSKTNIIVGVADRDYETALQAIYAKFA